VYQVVLPETIRLGKEEMLTQRRKERKEEKKFLTLRALRLCVSSHSWLSALSQE
jgi:hypothetical protein